MATVATTLTFARRQTQSDSNGLTDALGIEFANEALLDFRRRLFTAGVDAAQLQEAYRDMTADVGTYLYPTDMAWLKAIALNYADSTAQNYKTAMQVDVANLPEGQSFGWLRENAQTDAPMWNDMGDWFEIFPTPEDTNAQGIRIFYFLEPTEYTATTNTVTYPESLDYRILGWRIVSNFYYSLNKFDEGDRFNLRYEERVKQLIATLGRGSQQPIKVQGLIMSGWQY